MGDIMSRIETAESNIHSMANEATKEEAEDVSMESLLSDEEDRSMDQELKESNTDYSPTALKDALQKAEAVLTYNQIESDRLFKKADAMASDPRNLSKARMHIVKKAGAAAARAASARFIAEVEVTKLKAAVHTHRNSRTTSDNQRARLCSIRPRPSTDRRRAGRSGVKRECCIPNKSDPS